MDAVIDALRTSLDRDYTSAEIPTGAPVLVLEKFLPPHEMDQIACWATSQQDRFAISQVLSHSDTVGTVDTSRRRSRVMVVPGSARRLFERRLLGVIDGVRRTMGLSRFPITNIEMQLTASNDGDYYRCHSDNSHGSVGGRRLTYVFFFHREPKGYRGGDLRLYETNMEDGRPVRGPRILDIAPWQNRIVFFPSHLLHEVQTVECPSREFVDSRFTINGWFISSPAPTAEAPRIRRCQSIRRS
jgi:SM-20-related protein